MYKLFLIILLSHLGTAFGQGTTWNVTVYTSDLQGAGTNADVWLVISGNKGKTRALKLESPKNDLERNAVDRYQYTTVDIGEPKKIQVWIQGPGSWHAKRIEIQDVKQSRVDTYNLNRWFNSRNPIAVIATPEYRATTTTTTPTTTKSTTGATTTTTTTTPAPATTTTTTPTTTKSTTGATTTTTTTTPAPDQCSKGFTQERDICYRYINKGRTWSAADKHCRRFDAHLAEPRTQWQIDFLKNLSLHEKKDVWLGATDLAVEGEWVWAYSNVSVDGPIDWNPGQSNDTSSDDDEDCLEINYYRGKTSWNDVSCHHRNKVVCQKEMATKQNDQCTEGFFQKGNLCYRYISKSMTWSAADKHCRGLGAHLAEPRTQWQIDFLKTVSLVEKKDVWLGATDLAVEGEWVWTYSNASVDGPIDWNPSTPTGTSSDEDCLEIKHYRAKTTVNDISCHSRNKFVCQKEMDTKKIADHGEQTFCKGEQLSLVCPGNLVLNIVSAIHGRASLGKCPNERQGDKYCGFGDKRRDIYRRCAGRNSCSFAVTFNNWRDPCPHWTKSLTVVYKCLSDSMPRYSIKKKYKPPSPVQDLGPCDDGNETGDVARNICSHCKFVTPNPLEIGETMEVKCSVDNIGGIGKLPGISDFRVVRSVTLSKLVSNTSTMIAMYLPFNAHGTKRYGKDADRNSITMGGGGDDVLNSNINTIYISLVKKAECDDVIEYKCGFEYFTSADLRSEDEKDFIVKTTAKTLCGIVAPNPLVIGESSEVTCSVDNIGGCGKLPGISSYRILNGIKLSKVVSGTSTMIAWYLPFNDVSPKRYGKDADRNSITMDGGYNGTLQSNTNTMHITLNVNRAECKDVTEYKCEFEYFVSNDLSFTDVQAFIEKTTAKNDVPKIFVSAVPDNNDTIGYDLGASIDFDCSIIGDKGMDIQWEIERCQNKGTFYPIDDINFGDRDAVVTKEEKPLTKRSCTDPVIQFSSKLVYNISDDFCRIQCIVVDSKKNQIRKYESSSNFANGIKNVEANGNGTTAVAQPTNRSTAASQPRSSLINHLLKSRVDHPQVYAPHTSGSPHGPVVVSVAMSLLNILESNPETGEVGLLAWISLKWKDPSLSWDPKLYGNVTSQMLSRDAIWTPDIARYRLTKAPKSLAPATVRVSYNGQVANVLAERMSILCLLEEKENCTECNLALGSQTQDASALDLHADSSTLDVSKYFPGSNFLVEGNNVTRREVGQGPKPRVKLEMSFGFCKKEE